MREPISFSLIVEDRVRNLWKDLSVLELMEDSRVLLEEERLELERVRGKLEKATLMEEIYWRQKSRVLCIRDLILLIGLWWMENCLQIQRL